MASPGRSFLTSSPSTLSRRRFLQLTGAAGGATALTAGGWLDPRPAAAAEYGTSVYGNRALTSWVQGANVGSNQFRDGRFNVWGPTTVTHVDTDGGGSNEEVFSPKNYAPALETVNNAYWCAQPHSKDLPNTQTVTVTRGAAGTGAHFRVDGAGTLYVRQYVRHNISTMVGNYYTLSADIEVHEVGLRSLGALQIGVGAYIDYIIDFNTGNRQPVVNSDFFGPSDTRGWDGATVLNRYNYANTYKAPPIDRRFTDPGGTSGHFQGWQAALTIRIPQHLSYAAFTLRQLRLVPSSGPNPNPAEYQAVYTGSF